MFYWFNKQVSPVEIEEIMLKHASIKDVGVVGVPDKMAGQLTRAYVVLKEGYSLDEVRLAKIKQLTGGIRVVEVIPRNGLGKVSRKRLEELVMKDL